MAGIRQRSNPIFPEQKDMFAEDELNLPRDAFNIPKASDDDDYSDSGFGEDIEMVTYRDTDRVDGQHTGASFFDVFNADRQEEEAKEIEPEKIITDEELTEVPTEREQTPREIEIAENGQKMLIENNEVLREVIDKSIRPILATGLDAPKQRTYDKKVKYKKYKFAKAVDGKPSPLPKLLLMGGAMIILGSYMGVQANSYYIYKDGHVPNALNCAFGWIAVEGMPMRFSPFYVDVFFTAFALWAGLLGLVFLFSWLEKDLQKSSRIGHEQGNAKLMESMGFKKFKNRFMEK